MPTLEGILSQLREHEAQLRARGAVRLGIFGSYSRGEQREGSDLDVLVELDERTFDRYMDLRIYLEDLLGMPIDLVQADRIRPELREQIQGELIDAA
jgi:predicted nucleotidyltransferase